MNKIFLPTLKSIHLKDFSLYPNGTDFKFDFVQGVNLIIGGNGLGKTTFINLIKYGLIGNYKKDLGFVRTYQERSIETRKQLPQDYFSNRMDLTYSNNEKATITICFKINETLFEVERGLYEITLNSVKIREGSQQYPLTGKIIVQHKYEKLDVKEKQQYLQHSYETLVAKKANLFSFDDFIFFINEILLFGENHKTILWDEEGENVQERLSSKYFNDPKLDNQREEALRKSKYYDSLSRHKSEDIRAINEVIKKIKFKSKSDKNLKEVIGEIEKTKKDIDKEQKRLNNLQKERTQTINKQKINNASRNKLSRQIEEIEHKLNKINDKLADEIWIKLNPKFHTYLQNIKQNHICPMCNQDYEIKESEKNNDSTCFVCKQPIKKKQTESPKLTIELKELKNELDISLKKKLSLESEILKNENKLEEFDEEYQKADTSLFELKNQLRTLEHATNTDKKNGNSFELKAMMNQIKKLEKVKKDNQRKSQKEREKADAITRKIEDYNARITITLSKIFSQFAESFLHLKAYLTYDEFGGDKHKRFVPVIDGKPRLDSQSLSESQRFFIDHSYRMSLLSYFYQKPTFFICETPDSSLDISYERNAADVFLKFLKQPNSLILTSNLNNSEFLDYIVDSAEKIAFVNLLEIGKKSPIQSASKELDKIFNKIKSKIDKKNG